MINPKKLPYKGQQNQLHSRDRCREFTYIFTKRCQVQNKVFLKLFGAIFFKLENRLAPFFKNLLKFYKINKAFEIFKFFFKFPIQINVNILSIIKNIIFINLKRVLKSFSFIIM